MPDHLTGTGESDQTSAQEGERLDAPETPVVVALAATTGIEVVRSATVAFCCCCAWAPPAATAAVTSAAKRTLPVLVLLLFMRLETAGHSKLAREL